MGNSVSRPSCLGQKSPRPEDFPKEPCSATSNNQEEDGTGRSPEKACPSPRVMENCCTMALERAAKSSPLPKQNNLDLKLQSCCPLQTQQEGAMAPWTSPGSLGAGWGWKLPTTREVTEVTEVTETVVTEIVEVTEYPSGDRSRETSVTRMVKAAALPGGTKGAGLTPETAGKLGSWVSEVEDLMGHQKPPSGEAKVVKAQLQEQKLLLRLLGERTPHIGRLCQPLPAEPAAALEGPEQPRGLASLQEKWEILVQEAEARYSCLQQIVPAASLFQESVEVFQDWLSLTEQKLAQLWEAPGSLARSQDAHQQIQDLRREVQSKSEELEEALEHGWWLLQMVPGEEGRFVQGQMDSLRLRLLLVEQRSSDALQPMEQTVEDSSYPEPTQEGLDLGLQPLEKEQHLLGSQAEDGPCPRDPAGGEKGLSAETLRHRGLVERPVELDDPPLGLCSADVQEGLQPLGMALQEGTESLRHQSPACTLQLAQGQLLLAQHAKVQAELSQWLEETQQSVVAFSPGSITIGCNAFWEQQEALEGLREAIAEHKPLLGKLRHIITWLAELRLWGEAPLWQRLQVTEEQYGSLREQVQQAATTLREAIPRHSKLSEQLELVAGSLEWLQDHKRHPLALRGDPAWLQEELWENNLWLAELEKLGVALETLHGQGAGLQATLQSTVQPDPPGMLCAQRHSLASAPLPAAAATQEHLHDLWSQWQLLRQLEKDRQASLQELLALAGWFWPGLAKLARALGNTQQMVLDLEDTAASAPKDIQAKLVAMQALRKEVDGLQSELDSLGAWGMELMSSRGDQKKPTVTKSLDALYSSWNSLNRTWGERQKHLEDQLQALLTDQATMQGLLAWLAEAERRVAREFRGRGDPVQVEQELSELKAFKRELYQRQVEAERLWQQSSCQEAAQKAAPLTFGAFRNRWTQLEEELLTWQHRLEAALLHLGQFQSQLDWLLQWLLSTEEQLRSPLPLTLDLQSCEIELAKHQALQEAGWCLPSEGSGAHAEGQNSSLWQLSHRWSQLALEHNLNQVRKAAGLVQWLEQVELQLFSSKPMWSHSEATKEKLAPLLELCKEMESKRQTYQQVQEKLQHLLASCHPSGASTAEHSLRVLERKWSGINSHLQEQKELLLQSPNMAREHHASLQDLLRWVKQTEEALAALPPPSYILDTVSKQRRRQRTLAQETEAQSKKLAGMEARAAFLTQDNGGPGSLMGNTKERLAKVLQQVSERGEVLEEAHQQAKQFRESWRLLLKWMDGWEAACPAPTDAPPAKQEDLKALLGQHKGFQRRLWAKRPVFEATLQQGALLCGQALHPADGQKLEAMHRELKERWGALWSWAAERQQKLEGHRLFSGCFGDALQGLLDWLCRAEPHLAEETPMAGDRDLVGMLMEQHKAFQTELGRRAVAVTSLRCSAHVLPQGGSSVDAQWLQIQMEELEDHWELIGQLPVSQQSRLEVALRQAEEFHRLLSAFLSRLSGLEKRVMDGAPPEEEEEAAIAEGQSQLEEMQQSIQCQQLELDCISSLGEEILSTCHPDAVGTVQSWVTLAKTRFQQLCSRVQQQEQRLKGQAASLAENQEEAERLSAWITAAQEALRLQDQEPLPEDDRQLEEIGCQHMVFMRELDHKQAEVEKVAKSGRRKRAAQLGLTPSSSQRSPEVSLVDISSLEVPQENKPGRNELSGWVPAMPEDGLGPRLPWMGGGPPCLLDILLLQPVSHLLAHLSSAPQPTYRRAGWHGAIRALPRPSSMPLEDLQPEDPLLAELVHRWQWLWMAAQERQHRLQSAQRRLQELEEMAGFNFDAWRKRYLQWIGHRKSRVLDILHSIDQGQDGRITQQEFIRRVVASKFPTSLPEMKAVAKIFDMNRDGFIDYYEFISALHPSRDILHQVANVDHIQEEVKRQVAECNCVKRFQVEQISSTRYRFGQCQQLCKVRILRSTLMVRVGGGWTALDEFLVKNDPCRVKGRTNLKINERYLSPGLLGRKGAGSQSAPASKILSPSCSICSLSLYSSASAPSSPVLRKAVLCRTRSGDRCLHCCRSAGATGGGEPDFAAGAAGPDAEPPGHSRREAPSDVPAPWPLEHLLPLRAQGAAAEGSEQPPLAPRP